MDEDTFSFLPKIPKDLSHQAYCFSCYEEKVAPELALYNQDMEKAKEIFVFSKTQGKVTRNIRRTEPPFEVKDCAEEKEATMKLAFLAVRAGFNSLLDLDVQYEKIRNGSYQKLMWKGTAVPANVEVDKLPKDRANWQNPN